MGRWSYRCILGYFLLVFIFLHFGGDVPGFTLVAVVGAEILRFVAMSLPALEYLIHGRGRALFVVACFSTGLHGVSLFGSFVPFIHCQESISGSINFSWSFEFAE